MRRPDDAREPGGAADPLGKIVADAGAAGQQQLRLEGRNVPGFDAVLEVAAKAGLYTNLITAGVTLTRDRLKKLQDLGLDLSLINI